MQYLFFLLQVASSASYDPVATILGACVAVLSFFLVQFYFQVQSLVKTGKQLEIHIAVILERLKQIEKENEELKK